jgi:V8-like Glu-specific endopeptidase
MRLSSLLTALLIAAAPGLASAAEVDSTKRIDKRQDKQETRIDKERARVEHMQDKQSKAIAEQRKDEQKKKN